MPPMPPSDPSRLLAQWHPPVALLEAAVAGHLKKHLIAINVGSFLPSQPGWQTGERFGYYPFPAFQAFRRAGMLENSVAF